MTELMQELAEALLEWRDAGGPVSEVVNVIQAMIDYAIDEHVGPTK